MSLQPVPLPGVAGPHLLLTERLSVPRRTKGQVSIALQGQGPGSLVASSVHREIVDLKLWFCLGLPT